MSITLILIVANCLISIICFNQSSIFQTLKHYPYIEHKKGEYYRWLTSGFVHGDMMHLAVNMFVLYGFGQTIENYLIFHFNDSLGKIIYLISYLLIVVMADVPTYYKYLNNPNFSSVGASGGVAGVLFMYILLMPWATLELYAFIPIPAIIFGGLYLWYSSWSSKNQNDNIDHDAHFYGAIAGLAIAFVTRPAVIPEFFQKLIIDFPL